MVRLTGIEPAHMASEATALSTELQAHKRTKLKSRFRKEPALVPVAGVEPARCCHHGILSPARLPIPSHRLRIAKGNTAQSLPDGFARNLLRIFRHSAYKFLDIQQYACGISAQSDKKSDFAPFIQALCGVALNIIPQDRESVNTQIRVRTNKMENKVFLYIYGRLWYNKSIEQWKGAR